MLFSYHAQRRQSPAITIGSSGVACLNENLCVACGRSNLKGIGNTIETQSCDVQTPFKVPLFSKATVIEVWPHGPHMRNQIVSQEMSPIGVFNELCQTWMRIPSVSPSIEPAELSRCNISSVQGIESFHQA